MSKNLNLAVVGTGIFATDAHLPTIKQLNLTPVAAYNRTKAKADTFAQQAGIDPSKVADKLEDIFTDDSVDFVDALLPVQHNLSVVKLAIEHNKPLVFEKPIAATLAQAKEIVQLSRKSDLPIMVLENWVFSKGVKLMKDALPKIGEVVSFTYSATGAFNPNNKYANTSWRLSPEHVGGYLSDGGVHQLALLTEVLGPVDTISAHTRQIRKESGDDDVLFSTVKLESNAIGTFTYGSAFGAVEKTSYFVVYGTNGHVRYDFSPSAPRKVSYQTGSSSADASETVSEEFEDVDTMVAEFENFAAAVAAKDKSLVGVSPEKAFHHLAIVAAAIDSSKKNGASIKVETV